MKYGLKHRIIGAIILLSLAVIFLPIILDGGERPQLSQTTTPIPAAPPKPEIRVHEPVAKEPVDIVKKAPERGQWQSGLSERHTLAAWTLQAASFKDKNNAIKLRDRIRAKSIRSYVRERTPYFVVYAGPFADPGKADQVKAALKDGFGIKALMVSYDPMSDVRQ
ncbi:SPOR domain-containing protein [Oceanospirillum linum]|uniref:SPOR domain-containing protein n=1 Tax=Oceanospirillum linum TaxID=966 RepID=A0A1T1HEK1_OCELI|nr:SPOR domain-containing protein [Oceanospirillum linum]OOV88298.1 hypothetical protein BTA35_0201900 [Oceanospirillum linum]SEF51411.1 DedD protein [Oleiphilus messinensis]SMP04048.1 DedD protein [Oceanospirillum linum]